MKWSLKKFNGYCIIDLPKTALQETTVEALKDLLKDLSDNDYNVIYLNMGQISKVCSKNLACMISLYKFADFSNMEVKLYNIQPYVSQVIFQTRLNQVFDLCDPNIDFNSYHHQELCLSQAHHSSCQ